MYQTVTPVHVETAATENTLSHLKLHDVADQLCRVKGAWTEPNGNQIGSGVKIAFVENAPYLRP